MVNSNDIPSIADILRLVVRHADGEAVFDPNGQILMLLDHPETLQSWRPLPGALSDISGRPAVEYISNRKTIRLTVPEYARLAALQLRPDEFFKLRERFGVIHEWHEDFYDPETGEALQPVRAALPAD
jgi:hypothetical protein